jgi:hypothetical protein
MKRRRFGPFQRGTAALTAVALVRLTAGCSPAASQDTPLGGVTLEIAGAAELVIDRAELTFRYPDDVVTLEVEVHDGLVVNARLPQGRDVDLDVLGTKDGNPVAEGSARDLDIGPGDNRISVALTPILGDTEVGFDWKPFLRFVAVPTMIPETTQFSMNVGIDEAHVDDPATVKTKVVRKEDGKQYPTAPITADWLDAAHFEITVEADGATVTTCKEVHVVTGSATVARADALVPLLVRDASGAYERIAATPEVFAQIGVDYAGLARVNAALETLNRHETAGEGAVGVVDAAGFLSIEAMAVSPCSYGPGLIKLLLQALSAIIAAVRAFFTSKAAKKALAAAVTEAEKAAAKQKAMDAKLAVGAAIVGLGVVIAAIKEVIDKEKAKPEPDKCKLEKLEKKLKELEQKEEQSKKELEDLNKEVEK